MSIRQARRQCLALGRRVRGYNASVPKRRPVWSLLSLTVLLVQFGAANGVPPPVPMAAPLDEILVVGEQPGPPMWRISAGEHSLWLLGTLEPLPKDMVWRSRAVQERIGASQQVLTPPRVNPHVGFFKSLGLLPSLLHARHDPDGMSLEQSLPHEVYLHWLGLRVRYLGRDSDEKLRPLLAALDLYQHALEANGLTHDVKIWERVEQMAHDQHVPVLAVQVDVPIKDPKQYVRDLQTLPRKAEVECLVSTMNLLDSDLPSMRSRANYWATGDVERLAGLLRYAAAGTCFDAVLLVPSLRAEFERFKAQVDEAWMAAAEKALRSNASTVGVLPMGMLLGADGWLERFRVKGYEIHTPGQ
jgi:uncharacterized protein YbaP (TraB family)